MYLSHEHYTQRRDINFYEEVRNEDKQVFDVDQIQFYGVAVRT